MKNEISAAVAQELKGSGLGHLVESRFFINPTGKKSQRRKPVRQDQYIILQECSKEYSSDSQIGQALKLIQAWTGGEAFLRRSVKKHLSGVQGVPLKKADVLISHLISDGHLCVDPSPRPDW